jgi:hypothetical protein
LEQTLIDEQTKIVCVLAGYTKQLNDSDSCRDSGAIFTVSAFCQICRDGSFLDYDGFGHPVKDKMINIAINVYPSLVHLIPEDATHIVWYNK